ncbi:MAG: ATPase, partial [Oscillospiraceae bacterium]|nr:ATPase [Oscillospiraceae bacterium]
MHGLTDAQVKSRQAEYGLNTLEAPAKAHPLRIFFSQFRDFMVLILLAAATVSWLLGAYADTVTIAVIVVLNALLGFVQEYRTEQTLLALR